MHFLDLVNFPLQSISTMAISECGGFTAIGTLSGSVGIYDTHEMKALYFARETHGIFVTGKLFNLLIETFVISFFRP